MSPQGDDTTCLKKHTRGYEYRRSKPLIASSPAILYPVKNGEGNEYRKENYVHRHHQSSPLFTYQFGVTIKYPVQVRPYISPVNTR